MRQKLHQWETEPDQEMIKHLILLQTRFRLRESKRSPRSLWNADPRERSDNPRHRRTTILLLLRPQEPSSSKTICLVRVDPTKLSTSLRHGNAIEVSLDWIFRAALDDNRGNRKPYRGGR